MYLFRYKITGYVIMPNHVHFIIFYTGTDHQLNQRVTNRKRFMAYEIVKRLKLQQEINHWIY